MLTALTDKQKRFCEEYMIDLNATQAAIRAGYSEKTAAEIGRQNLIKLDVADYISKLKSDISQKTDISAQKVVNEFAKIAFSSIAHLHNSWIELAEFESLTYDQKACIESIKTKRKEIIGSDGKHTGIYDVEVHIKLYDKLKALENLGKHTGIYEADNEQKNNNHNCSDDELIGKLTEFAKVISATEG